jgi:hypothetical protein
MGPSPFGTSQDRSSQIQYVIQAPLIVHALPHLGARDSGAGKIASHKCVKKMQGEAFRR